MHSVLVHLRSSTKGIYDKPGWHSEHLGIGYLAASLRSSGHSVDVLDAAAEDVGLGVVFDRL